MNSRNFVGRALLTCTMAGGLLLAAGTAPIHAAKNNDDEECQSRVSKAEMDVDKDVAQHGEGSHQVANDLKKLDQAREWCAKHHADWEHSKDKQYDHYRDLQKH